MLRGTGIGELWTEMALLVGFVIVILGVAVLRFRKTLD